MCFTRQGALAGKLIGDTGVSAWLILVNLGIIASQLAGIFIKASTIMRSSRLSSDAFEQMIEGARILEADSHGAKVYLLHNGNILKLFRRKRWLSSALLRPYSRRFISNAIKLQSLGVPTLQVLAFYRLPKPTLTAVLYEPLEGQTLRQIASHPDFDWHQLLPLLAALIRRLHDLGIYFRSLHLGNIVVTSEKAAGLIDIADMSFRSAPLSQRLARRNLQHFSRYIAREGLSEKFPMKSLENAVLSRSA